jgi:hypothetical protein
VAGGFAVSGMIWGLSMQKLGAGASIVACLAICGCADSPVEARQKYEQSTANYRACLVANQNNVEACQGRRMEMETALSDSDDAFCRSYGLKYGTPSYVQCRQNIGGAVSPAILTIQNSDAPAR